MSPLLISLGAGVLIGLIYALLNVRSPAPPAIALIGLLGMVIGGQLAAQFIHQDTAQTHSLPDNTLSVDVAKPASTLSSANKVG